MIKNPTTRTREKYSSLSAIEKIFAKAYIQGAVHGFCNNVPDGNLSVRALFGGDNRDWGDTPLQCIYNYYCAKKASDPVKGAAIDVGYLLEEVLEEDPRQFEYIGDESGKIYKLL